MAFVADTDANYQAYLYAKGLVESDQRDQWVENFIQALMFLATGGTTLVTNGGTRVVPTGSVATVIGQANASRLQNRNF